MSTDAGTEFPLRRRLCVFLRAPVLGQVKTRLAASLGAPATLAAYLRLVEHLLGRLAPPAEAPPAEAPPADVLRELWYAGEGADARLRDWSRDWGGRLVAQPPGDLGARMQTCLAATSGSTADRSAGAPVATVLVGSDCAGLAFAHCRQAWGILETDPEAWVFAPAEDGGFGLVACRAAAAHRGRVFAGVDWDAGDTLQQCLDQAEREGIPTRLIDPVWDVDTVDDWRRFERTFPSSNPSLLPPRNA